MQPDSLHYKPVKNFTLTDRHKLIFYARGAMASQGKNSVRRPCVTCQSYSPGAGDLIIGKKRPRFLGPGALSICFQKACINFHQFHKCLSRSRFLNLDTLDILDQINSAVGAVLCIAGCFAASLASAHQMPVALPPSWDNQQCPDLAQYPLGDKTAPS